MSAPNKKKTDAFKTGSLSKRRHPDIEIARVLVKKGFVSKDDAMEILRDQKARAEAGKPRITLVQLAVKKKLLPRERLRDAQDEVRRHTYICPNCDARAVLAPSQHMSDASCPRCGAQITVEPTDKMSETPTDRKDAAPEFGSAQNLALPGPPGVEKFSTKGQAFGRYELLEEIGRGAMGVVYRARHMTLGKEVALKVLLAGEDARDAQIARFRREAAAVQRLRHDGIVAIHDFGAEGDVYFLTMDLVPGGLTLHKLWKDPEEAPNLKPRLMQVAQVAHAIDHANARGIIHRDLKPANVLLAPDGAIKVADFGLAKDEADEAGLTLSQDRLGTPLFMAPEQVRKGSASIDHRADVWALGVMAFVAITGRYPFRARTIMSLYLKILHDDPDWTGLNSEAPDKDGFGKAPEPRELQELEKQRGARALEATDVDDEGSSPKKKKKKLVSERQPPPFVPPRDLEGKPVPEDLKSVIEMALAKDPDGRYETAGALARDLERFVRGQRVRAQPPGKLGKLWRRAKRKKVPLLAAAVLILVPCAVILEKERRAAHDRAVIAEQEAERKRKEADEAKAAGEKVAKARAAEKAAEEAWTRRVLSNPKLEDYVLVANELEEVARVHATQPAPFIKLGLAHAFSLELEKARADFDRVQKNLSLEAGISREAARSGVILAFIREDMATAIKLGREGLKNDPGDPLLLVAVARALVASQNAADAENVLKPLLDKRSDPEALIVGAQACLLKKDFPRAGELLEKAQSLAAGQSPELHAMRARLALARGEVDGAIREFGEARDLFAEHGPQNATYFLNLAKAKRREKGATKELLLAAEANGRAQVLAPWSPIPCFWRAEVYRDLVDGEKVIDCLDEAIRRDPYFEEAATIRSEFLLARRDKEGLDRAEKRFLEEKDVRGRLDLAAIHLARAKDADARARVRAELDALSKEDGGGRAWLFLEDLDKLEGKDGKASRAKWEQSVERQKNDRQAFAERRDRIALARVRLIRGDAAGALEVLPRYDRDNKDPSWGVSFRRYSDTGKIASALRGFAKALKGDLDGAFKDLESAGYEGKGRVFAPEIHADALAHAPELESAKSDPRYQRLLERAAVSR